MNAIIKTWPSFMERHKVLEVFHHDWGHFYFTLGKGKPAKPIAFLYYTHRGQIIGHFQIDRIVQNRGDNLPKLHSISGEVSEWQIKLMNWVAICRPPFYGLEDRLFYSGFRGWRYFSIEDYRGTLDAKVRL